LLGEGCREIGRKMDRVRLHRRLAAHHRERDTALAQLGRVAWESRIDLSSFEELRSHLERLDVRAGELAATAARLEAERDGLSRRRQAEVGRFDSLSRAAQGTKSTADAALRAAQTALGAHDQAIDALDSRLAQVAAAQARLAAPAERTMDQAPAAAGTPVASERAQTREQLETEQRLLLERVAAARTARIPMAAGVDRSAAEAAQATGEVSRIEAERTAALSPIDAELERVRQESGGAGRESSMVGREQAGRFSELGGALFEEQVAHPALSECRQAVERVNTARAATQDALGASFAMTAAMPRATMPKFYAVAVVLPALLAAVAYVLYATVATLPESSGDVAQGWTLADAAAGMSSSVAAEEAAKDAAVQAFIRSPRDRAGRSQAVDILAEDIIVLGSTADRSYVPPLILILQRGEPELRSAAADAIGMIGPTSDEAPLLMESLNDPVPAVRAAALRALQQVRDDERGSLVVRRVQASREGRRASGHERIEPELAPDPRQLGVALYPGATFLHFASDMEAGRAAFGSADPVEKVVEFHVRAAGRPALGGEEFSRAYFGGSPGDPSGALRLATDNDAWLRQTGRSGLSVGDIEAELERRTALMTNLPLVRYADPQLYGSLTFVALQEPPVEGSAGPVRFVVVFTDRALRRTGFEIHGAQSPGPLTGAVAGGERRSEKEPSVASRR
jgi:hypothetical protein